MAKKSAIARNKKRERLVAKYAKKRAELKAVLANPETADDEFYAAQRALDKLPKNSCPIRLRNRCGLTGRPRAYSRKFNVSRIVLRELATRGYAPGVIKSSW